MFCYSIVNILPHHVKVLGFISLCWEAITFHWAADVKNLGAILIGTLSLSLTPRARLSSSLPSAYQIHTFRRPLLFLTWTTPLSLVPSPPDLPSLKTTFQNVARAAFSDTDLILSLLWLVNSSLALHYLQVLSKLMSTLPCCPLLDPAPCFHPSSSQTCSTPQVPSRWVVSVWEFLVLSTFMNVWTFS